MKLRVRPAPYEDESLLSYLVRLSRSNGYGTPFAVRAMWRQRLEALGMQDDLKLPDDLLAFMALAELTEVSPRVLFGMTAHRFARGMLPPEKMVAYKLTGGTMPLGLVLSEQQRTRHLRPASHAAYCPRCLQDGVYHRAWWEPLVVTVCPAHGCYLVDQCPGCKKSTGVADVARGACRWCGQRLASAPVTCIDPGCLEYQAQETLRGWLSRDGTENQLGIEAEPITEPLNALYYVLIGLRAPLMADSRRLDAWGFPVEGRVPGRIARSDLSIPLHTLLLAAAFKALQSWPKNFHAFLDVLRAGQNSLAGFGNLYVRHIAGDWATVPYIFVQHAFDEYLMRDPELCAALIKSRRFQEHPDLLDQFPFVTLEWASSLLGVTSGTVGELVQRGTLRRYNKTASRYVMLKKSEVEALDATWKGTLSLVEAGIRLGLWHDNLPDLVAEGLLAGQKGIGRGGNQEWGFRVADVDGLLCSVSVRVVPSGDEGQGPEVRFEKAVRSGSVVKANSAKLLKAVLDGRIEAHVMLEKWRLCDLQFYVGDLDRLWAELLAEAGWVNRADIARRMRVKDTVVAKWIAAGLLTPVTMWGNVTYFDAGAVDRFIAEHLFTEEAADILGVGVLVVQRWARLGRLHPVAGTEEDGCHRYLFRRDEVERLRPENRLTAPQIAEVLGISRSTLGEWVREGRIQPISGPDIDGCSHYLFLKT